MAIAFHDYVQQHCFEEAKHTWSLSLASFLNVLLTFQSTTA
jgi:hypothetical protein